jgi:hypothetical protein
MSLSGSGTCCATRDNADTGREEQPLEQDPRTRKPTMRNCWVQTIRSHSHGGSKATASALPPAVNTSSEQRDSSS